jgi:tungstate transport system ATP-binding protein
MTGGAELLRASNFTVSRGGARVLDLPEFVLHQGEIVSLIGPNGAGKSTMLLALAGLLPATGGEFSCRQEKLASDRALFAYRRRLAMVFQEPLLFEGTVAANVAAGLKLRSLSREVVRARVAETLALFNITHLAERSARKLSGGEAQRTSLARAFAIQPEIIFLDEPFGALDPPTKQALMTDLERILTETATAAILTTHDQLEALRLSDRMLVIHGGRIVQSGSPAEVMNRPCNEFVASFVGMENVLSGIVTGQADGLVTIALAGCHVDLAGVADVGESAVVCIRPEHVTIETHDPAGETSARNVFPAVVRKILPSGAYFKIMLDCGFPLVAYLTHQSIIKLQIEEQRSVFASFKATAVHLIRSGRRDDSRTGH